ncbi:MAG TPA: hypothetical protein VNX21_08410, partial [Candidatus Thermoplasmatota archaeon]|nr:hypothetical protein [Candidatus Thermoplasmatota archaeon]
LAVTVSLAEQRTARATSIFVIYGDAAGRRNVTADATAALGRQLENASMKPARDVGLLGVFHADAIDRASKTRGYAEQGRLDLGIVIAAWAALDHAGYVASTLGLASPVQPPATQDDDGAAQKKTPAWGLAALVALGAVAVALGRRRA